MKHGFRRRITRSICAALCGCAVVFANPGIAMATNVFPTEGYAPSSMILSIDNKQTVDKQQTRTASPPQSTADDPPSASAPTPTTEPLAQSASATQMPTLPFETDRFYLLLNKETCQLTIYFADQYGNRTDFELCTITVAIGKRTTPTPAGKFTLGGTERWHYFGPSYAPFAIEYTPGKYLHGPLYHSANDTAINTARLADFGKMMTGGCIRIPAEDARWIYENCSAGTQLEIINGI